MFGNLFACMHVYSIMTATEKLALKVGLWGKGEGLEVGNGIREWGVTLLRI